MSSIIRNLINIKSKVLVNKNLKNIFDYLLNEIENKKGNLQLENILELLSFELEKNNIKSIICVINAKENKAIVRHVNFPGPFRDFFNTKNISAINFQNFSKYQEVLKRKESVFCQDRISQFRKIIPQSKKYLNDKDELNSIISPLILKGEIIGTLEILSEEFKREDIKTIDDFVEKLVISITNNILFNEIKESAKRYKDLFKNSSDGLIFFDINNKKFSESNNVMREISGYTQEEFKQLHYLRLFEESERKRIEEFINAIQKNKTNHSNVTKFSTKIKTKNKKIRDVNIEIGSYIYKGEICFNVHDVTEKKRNETRVRESEEKYRMLVDNANDGVMSLGLDGEIQFINKATTEIFELEKNKIINSSIFDYIHKDDKPLFSERFKSRINGKEVISNYDFKIIIGNKKTKTINYSGTPIKKYGKIIGVQCIVRDVSKKQEFQQKITNMKRYYEKVINSIQDEIVVIDKSNKIISINQFFAKNVDLPEVKIIGAKFNNVLEKYKNGVIKTCCAGETCQNKCNISKVFREGEPLHSIERGTDENDNIVYNAVSVFPVKNENEVYQVVMTIRDVSREKRVEENNRRLTEFNQKILDSSPISILVLDKKGEIILANNMAKKIMKMGKNILGENLFETKDMKNNNSIRDGYKSLFHGGKSFLYDNFSYKTDNKKTRFLNIIAVPLYGDEGKVEVAISMALDNTDKVLAQRKLVSLNSNLEEKVKRRTEQLEKANIELNKVLELKSKFLSDASHELRTPLTIIQGNLDLSVHELKQKKEEIPEAYLLIEKEIEQMTGILSDLTMLTNADAMTESIDYNIVDLNNIVSDVALALEVVARRKKIKIKLCRLDDDARLMGDETKLEKLLLNIVRNAIKYTEEKGEIEICVSEDNKNVIVEVKDNGIGIPEQDLPNIFERFYRVDKARSRQEGGTGLGLSICKWIAEAHGGFISVTSKVGEGSTFKVVLPKEKKGK